MLHYDNSFLAAGREGFKVALKSGCGVRQLVRSLYLLGLPFAYVHVENMHLISGVDVDILRYEPLELDQVEDTKLCEYCRQAISAVPSAATWFNTKHYPDQTLLKVKKDGVDHTLGREQGCGLCEILLSSGEFGRRWEKRRSTRVGGTTYDLKAAWLFSVGYKDNQSSCDIRLYNLPSEG
jgi:hypothetical protein